MVKKITYFFISILFLITSYLLSYRLLNPSLAWLGFPIGLLFLKWFDISIIHGIISIKKISKERIELNLKAAGLFSKNESYKKNLYVKLFCIIIGYFILFTYSLSNDIKNIYQFVSQSIKISKPIIKIEFPSYAGQTPQYYDLSIESYNINMDTSSYIEIFIDNIKNNNTWQVLFIEDQKIYPEKNYTYSLFTGSWSSSVASLYSLFEDKSKILDPILSNSNLKKIKLILTNKEKKYTANLIINPTKKPIVKLDFAPSDTMEKIENKGKLNFNIDVKSLIPLTLVQLSIRTKSGYHFDKFLAEFANASEFNFMSDNAELVTLGIPFLQEDILYVKAVAKTVLSGIYGESNELVFPIKTPIQVRSEIIKKLEEAKNLLTKIKKVNSEQKSKIISPLSNAAHLAENLSKSGIVRRNIIESINYIENMSLKKDLQYNNANAKIQTTINILKRQQNVSESGNFLARLQNFKSKIQMTHSNEKDYLELFSESSELSEFALHLNKQLNEMTKNETYPLTKNEKTMLQNVLNNDSTAQKIRDTGKNLKEKKLIQAQQGIQNALEEANNHLGFAMQIMQQARQRAMQDAKLKLQKSDALLENSKYLTSKNEVLNDLSKVNNLLDKTPKLGGEFNEFLNEAKSISKKATHFASVERTFEKIAATQKAQEAVEKAILSLQDEEESDKELQKEQDARAFRSTMDVLAAQGLLDLSWRKKILEEISRLKSQGETSDSQMIRYLESRLR